MVKKYKRQPGSRPYCNYTLEYLKQACTEYLSGMSTLREASKKYKIPISTLSNKCRGKHTEYCGHPTALTENEELYLVELITTCSNWGFPISLRDIRAIACDYLQSIDKEIRYFSNKFYPGHDWAKSFVNRHKKSIKLTQKSNVTCPAVTPTLIKNYFDELIQTLKNVPPSNIFNYYEINVTNDTGEKKILLLRRGTKYPVRLESHSKSCTTIMFCASASGILLPPYVIYKSENFHSGWSQDGPQGEPLCSDSCCQKGALYNRTKSGWIDTYSFKDWFFNLFLPHAQQLRGKIVLFGDNLSSHFSKDVIEACRANDISFACFIPNNINYVRQPLDVTFFQSMKQAWRKILKDFKKDYPELTLIPKAKFPGLIKICIEAMNNVTIKNTIVNNRIEQIIISGFRVSGIVPLDQTVVLKKLPEYNFENDSGIENVLSHLSKKRYGDKENSVRETRSKILKIVSSEQSCSEQDIKTNDESATVVVVDINHNLLSEERNSSLSTLCEINNNLSVIETNAKDVDNAGEFVLGISDTEVFIKQEEP